MFSLQNSHGTLTHDQQLHEADLHVTAYVHVNGAGDLLTRPILVVGRLVHIDIEERHGILFALQSSSFEGAPAAVVGKHSASGGPASGVGGIQPSACRGVAIANCLVELLVVVVLLSVFMVRHGPCGPVAENVRVGVLHTAVDSEHLAGGSVRLPASRVFKDITETGAFGRSGGKLGHCPRASVGHPSCPGSA